MPRCAEGRKKRGKTQVPRPACVDEARGGRVQVGAQGAERENIEHGVRVDFDAGE